jgi:hypothetical protein
MKISSKDKTFDKGTTMQKLLVVPALGLLLAGCNPADGTATGVASNDGFSLYCPNVGIAADQCILSDPENPYASQTVNDSTKYTLAAAAPNERAKFYLWATAQAKSQSGENQYNTALSLHQLFDDNANTAAQAQAKVAYESVLDNYYNATSEVSVATDMTIDGDDYEWGTWGGSSTLDAAFTGDSTYSPVVKVTSGKASWDAGLDIGVISLYDLAAGTVDKYTHLNFKIKDVDGSTINIKVTDPNGNEHGAQVDVAFALSAVATDIGSTGWKQVSIPLTDSNFKFLATTKEVSIHTGTGVADTYMVTDINFSGDDTGNGLVGDTAPDGFVSIYNPTAASTDFTYGTGTGYEYTIDTWGTFATLNHQASDAEMGQVYSVVGAGGTNWGSTIAFVNFDAGFAAPYKNLEFKVKDLTDNTIKIKFAGGGDDKEIEVNVATQGSAIAGKTGWYHVVVPIASNFTGASANHEFAMFSDKDDTWYFTDLGFTGDATGNGLTGDTVADGMLTFYRSGSAVSNFRDLVGENLVEPATLDNLYGTSSAATTALSGMGFSYDTATNTLTAD